MARASEFDEDDVIRRCRAGDEEAWRALVERYQDMVYSIARRVAGPAADDAAQETFLRVFRKLDTYRGSSGARARAKFSSWLYRVAYNCACDVASSRGLVAAPPDEFERRYDGPGPEELAAGAEHKRLTREALASIRPEYRNVLELYYLMGKSYEQVSEVTALPLGTVKSYIYRGKKAVLASLRRMGVADALAGGM